MLTILESLCCTYGMKSNIDTEYIAITYFLSGLLIGILPIIIPATSIEYKYSNSSTFTKINKWLTYGGFILLSVFFIINSLSVMKTMPVDLAVADMLPQIKAMCDRLLHGEKIYAPIKEIWGGKLPPYMPLMWLPYSVAEWLDIDIRFTTIAFLLLGLFGTFLILPKQLKANPLLIIISLVSILFLFNYMLVWDPFLFGGCEEGVVIGYYLFLAYALVKRKPVLLGIAIASCLMSRFSLFFWVPMYLLYVFIYESKRQAYIITGVIAIIVLFVFLIPFGFSQPEYFLNIPADYQVGVDRAWSFNNDNGKYYQDFLGYTRYFDISQIKLLHNLQIGVAAVVPFLLLGLFSLGKKRFKLNSVFFGICTLKITLVFFYNMVEVPYHYLFFVSTFFSYPILFAYIKQRYRVANP